MKTEILRQRQKELWAKSSYGQDLADGFLLIIALGNPQFIPVAESAHLSAAIATAKPQQEAQWQVSGKTVRECVKCPRCELVQFPSQSKLCRKCKQILPEVAA